MGVPAGEAEQNALGGPVQWLFTTQDARIKLKRLDPQYSYKASARRPATASPTVKTRLTISLA
jgi:hypothetical protein